MSLQAQVLKINNTDVDNGEFSYNRGDSIFIAGENDTVSLKDSLMISLYGPKVKINQSAIIDSFSTGYFKAFYDGYEKINVVANMSFGDTLCDVDLDISGGVAPYTAEWFTISDSDTVIFDEVSNLFPELDFSSLLNTIQTKYNDTVLRNLTPGKYTCRVSDSLTSNYFNVVIGNMNDEIDTVNCFINKNYDVICNDTGSNWDSYFNYRSYFPINSGWKFSSYLTDSSTYTIGLSDTTRMMDSTDVEYGLFVNKGIVKAIVNGEVASQAIKYRQMDNISMEYKNNAFIVKRNNSILYKRYVMPKSDDNYAFVGNLKSGNIVLSQLYLPIAYPLPISLIPRIEKNHLICGVENSGKICSTFPTFVNWTPDFLNNGECMYNLPADDYTITYQDPFNTSIATQLGYKCSWFTEGLETVGMSGLRNESVLSFGTANSAQKILDPNASHWVELSLDFENAGQSIMVFLLERESTSAAIGFGIFVDSNTGNAIYFLYPVDDNSPIIPGTPFSPSEQELFKIRTQGVGNDWNIYRIITQNFSSIGLDLTSGYNFSTPNLTGANLVSALSPGEAKLLNGATSFGCEAEHPCYELRKHIEGQNYPVSLADGHIRFAYEEPYLDNGTGDQLSIYKYSEANVGSPCAITGFNPLYGYNEYEESIDDCGFIVGDVGLLELRTEKNEKWYLRFKIVE